MNIKLKGKIVLSLFLTLAVLASLVPAGGDVALAQTAKPKAISPATASNITITSGTMAVGATAVTTVSVNGYNNTASVQRNFAGFDLRVAFDRTKVNVWNDPAGLEDAVGDPSGYSVIANSPFQGGNANSTGILTLVGFKSTGLAGPTINLATIKWQGVAGGVSALTLSVITLSDRTGDDVAVPPLVNGSATVWQAPVASFTKSLNPSSGLAPNTVTFTDTSVGPGQTWSWSFGDGTGSSSQNPTKLYNNPGNYIVSLAVANPVGNSSTTQTVSIYSVPTAGFTKSLNPATGVAPVTVTFSDNSGGNPTGYSWTFGDGSGSSSQNPSKTYNIAGNYTVTLTASNPVGSGSTSQTVGVYSTPAASFSKSVSGSIAPVTAIYSDTSSGNPTGWSWNLGDGSGSSSQNPTKIYNTGGNYSVTLTATNPAGSNTSAGQTVTVYSTPAANFTASPTSTNPGTSIQFTDISDGNITNWSWGFGDGTGSSSQNPTKSYAADGAYNVSLTASNPAGTNTITKSSFITIISFKAETALTNNADSSRYAYLGVLIKRFFNPVTSDTVDLSGFIGAYDAYLTYNGASIKNSVGLGDFVSPTVNPDTMGGTKTTFNGFKGSGNTAKPPDLEIIRLFPHLTGSRTDVVTFTLHFNTITRTGGGEVPQNADVTKTAVRGDANNSGAVNITDALFIAQYLAGLRTLGETSTLVNPINSATPRADSDTVGDNISIQDALFIAQMLAGLRDSSYNFVVS